MGEPASKTPPAANLAAAPATSRLPRFYERPLAERMEAIASLPQLSAPSQCYFAAGGGLPLAVADKMTENVIGIHALPLSVGLNIRLNGMDRLVPMAVEEPSVVAAFSNASRLVRHCGGFHGGADPAVMTGQIQLDDVANAADAAQRIHAEQAHLLELGNRAIPRMVERGGGCVDLEVRVLEPISGLVVVDVFVAVGEAMGANLIDTVAEAMAPAVHKIAGGTMGVRILSNLPLRRMAWASAQIPTSQLRVGLAEGIFRASRFAEHDATRAVTHNKGIMNGIDSLAVAVGQDWRAIEAGAHAYAALSGRYRPLSTWKIESKSSGAHLMGEIRLPLAVGIVGGAQSIHPGAQAALELTSVANARELAVLMAATGLASNLAALHALAGDGIQTGHMRLHNRRFAQAQSGKKESL